MAKTIRVAFSGHLPEGHIQLQLNIWLKKNGAQGIIRHYSMSNSSHHLIDVVVDEHDANALALKYACFIEEFGEIFGRENTHEVSSHRFFTME